MNLSFDQPDNNTSFSALFIHQDSYINALRKANFCFGLNLLSSSRRELPLVKTAYMKISDKGTVKPGKSARVSIMELIYSKTLKLLVGIARLKRNFTCMTIPYIVLAGSTNDNIVTGLVSGKHNNLGGIIRHSVDLSLNGKIGNASIEPDNNVGIDNNETIDGRETKTYDTNQPSASASARARASVSVSDSDSNSNGDHNIKYMYGPGETSKPVIPDCLNKYFMQREQNLLTNLKKHGITSDVTITTSDGYIKPEVAETVERLPTVKTFKIAGSDSTTNDSGNKEEIWNGLKIHRGTRGGKYVIKNGRKKYIKVSGTGEGATSKKSSNIVYNVRLSGTDSR